MGGELSPTWQPPRFWCSESAGLGTPQGGRGFRAGAGWLAGARGCDGAQRGQGWQMREGTCKWLNGRQVGSGSVVGRDATQEAALRRGGKSTCVEVEGRLCLERKRCRTMEIALVRREMSGAVSGAEGRGLGGLRQRKFLVGVGPGSTSGEDIAFQRKRVTDEGPECLCPSSS